MTSDVETTDIDNTTSSMTTSTTETTDLNTTTSQMTASTTETTDINTTASPMTASTTETTDMNTTTSQMTASTTETTDMNTTTLPMTASTTKTTGIDTTTLPMTASTVETTDIDTTTLPMNVSTTETTGIDTTTSSMTASTTETTDIDTTTLPMTASTVETTDIDTATSSMTASTTETTDMNTTTLPMTASTVETTDIDTATSSMTASTTETTSIDTTTLPMTVSTTETTDIYTATSPMTTPNAGTYTDTKTSSTATFDMTTTAGNTILPSTIDAGTTTRPVNETTVKSTMTTTPTVGTTTVRPTEKPKTEAKTEATTKPTTKPPEEPATTPLKVGPIPEATVPDIDEDFNKTYQFEIAIEENSAEGCTSDNLTTEACRTFKISVTLELEALYEVNSAFVSVDVALRAGSVIVSHNVTYSYNSMSEEERKMSAQEFYDETIGKAVDDGTLGNYTIENYCGSCLPPKETSDICSQDLHANCPSGFDQTCETGYLNCESKCITDREYCSENGICWQEDMNEGPICSCDWNNGEWYWGYNCQYHVDQTYLIIGCSCGGAVLLVLLVSIIGYLYAKTMDKSEKTGKSSVDGDDVINAFQNHGFVNGNENIFPPIDDIDNGDILQRRRPYSYIYNKGDGPTDMTSSSFITKQKQNGGVGHEGKRESGLEVIDDSSKRHSQSSNTGSHQEMINSEFWGDSAAEHIKLEPFLSNADDSDDSVPHPNQYKIQRPRISNYYSFGNSEVRLSMDPSGYQGFPEPDYGQR
nr:mucin-3A-like [Lytechinus pictus]